MDGHSTHYTPNFKSFTVLLKMKTKQTQKNQQNSRTADKQQPNNLYNTKSILNKEKKIFNTEKQNIQNGIYLFSGGVDYTYI